MKPILALLALSTGLTAESTVGFTFNIQSNSLFCDQGADTCKPPEERLAGVMVLAKSSSEAVIGYRVTVVTTLANGNTLTKTVLIDRWPGMEYTGTVVWLGKEPSDFSNTQITVEGLYKQNDSATGQTPGVEY